MDRDQAVARYARSVQVGDDDDRELQPLRLVDRHQTHAGPLLVAGRGLLFSGRIVAMSPELSDEIGEQEPALAIEIARHRHELSRVCQLPWTQELADQGR